jgi:DNA-binding NtrC family response regulator
MKIPKTVVHIDDDPAATALVAAYLAEEGYQVAELHNPCDYLAQMPRRGERMVILDIDMPEMDGLEVHRRIKAFDGGIQTIILSGVVTMATVMELMRDGAEACFFKPLDGPEALLEAVNCGFRKMERWWLALDELSRRRKAEAAQPRELTGTAR